MNNKGARQDTVATEKALWEKELDEWTHERDSFSLDGDWRKTLTRLRFLVVNIYTHVKYCELGKAMPVEDVMVSTDIGNINSAAKQLLYALKTTQLRNEFATVVMRSTIHRRESSGTSSPRYFYAGDGAGAAEPDGNHDMCSHNIPVTAVVFHNRQWGAEKKNQVDFYKSRFVAGELENQSLQIARAMGAEGITVDKLEDVGPTLQKAIDMQMNEGKTTIIEIMCTQELGDLFRRDALYQHRLVSR